MPPTCISILPFPASAPSRPPRAVKSSVLKRSYTYGEEGGSTTQLAALMADCILRGKEIGSDVAKLRAQHLEMGYCFNDAQFEAALEKLAEKTGL